MARSADAEWVDVLGVGRCEWWGGVRERLQSGVVHKRVNLDATGERVVMEICLRRSY